MLKVRLFITTLLALGATNWLFAQDKSTTQLRPSTKLEPGVRPHEELAKQMESLRGKLELHAQALARLEELDDGSRQKASGINLLRLILLEDRAKLIAMAEPAATRLSWHIDLDIGRKQALIQRRQLDVQVTQRRKDELAEKIVKAESKVTSRPGVQLASKTEGDADDADAKEATIDGWKAQLEELIKQHDEREADVKSYQGKIAEYEQEKRDLGVWDARMSGLGGQWKVRAERLADAVEHQSDGEVAEEVKVDREGVRQALDLLRSLPRDDNGRPRRQAPGDPPQVATGKAIDRDPPAAPTTSPRLLDELEKARKRVATAK